MAGSSVERTWTAVAGSPPRLCCTSTPDTFARSRLRSRSRLTHQATTAVATATQATLQQHRQIDHIGSRFRRLTCNHFGYGLGMTCFNFAFDQRHNVVTKGIVILARVPFVGHIRDELFRHG